LPVSQNFNTGLQPLVKPQATLSLACGYENSAFQAGYNTLTFSPNGLNFHNRIQAKRGMRQHNRSLLCLKGKTLMLLR
jgi:hypothetical protein